MEIHASRSISESTGVSHTVLFMASQRKYSRRDKLSDLKVPWDGTTTHNPNISECLIQMVTCTIRWHPIMMKWYSESNLCRDIFKHFQNTPWIKTRYMRAFSWDFKIYGSTKLFAMISIILIYTLTQKCCYAAHGWALCGLLSAWFMLIACDWLQHLQWGSHACQHWVLAYSPPINSCPRFPM